MISKSHPPLEKGRGKSRFLYRQLADRLRSDIEEGRLTPGDMLPSMDDLAKSYHINKATVRQAFAELIASGLIYSVPAKGTFVAEHISDRRDSSKKSRAIGWVSTVVGDTVMGQYHAAIMDAIRSELRDIKCHLVIQAMNEIPPSSFCHAVDDAELDGMIIVGPFADEPVRQLLSSGVPTVVFDDQFRGDRIDTVLIDNRLGGQQAAEHLLSFGHRQLAFVTGPLNQHVSKDRLLGAREAMEDAGVDPKTAIVIESNFTPEGGDAALQKLLKLPKTPTGVFFFNDEMAFGALHSLYAKTSLRVPGDISFVGFDDIPWASVMHPPLTTIRVNKRMIGKVCVERLQKQFDQQNHRPETIIVPTHLEFRESTASPKRK